MKSIVQSMAVKTSSMLKFKYFSSLGLKLKTQETKNFHPKTRINFRTNTTPAKNIYAQAADADRVMNKNSPHFQRMKIISSAHFTRLSELSTFSFS